MAYDTRRKSNVRLRVVERDEYEAQIVQAERPVLAALRTDDIDDSLFVDAVAAMLAEQQAEIDFVAIDKAAYADLIGEWRQNKGYRAHDFDKLPGAILFRGG